MGGPGEAEEKRIRLLQPSLHFLSSFSFFFYLNNHLIPLLFLLIDQRRLDEEISNIRKKLKERTHDLEILSGGDGNITSPFIDLKSITADDLYGITGRSAKTFERVVEGE